MVRASFQNIWTWAYIVDYNISKRNVGILQKKKNCYAEYTCSSSKKNNIYNYCNFKMTPL